MGDYRGKQWPLLLGIGLGLGILFSSCLPPRQSLMRAEDPPIAVTAGWQYRWHAASELEADASPSPWAPLQQLGRERFLGTSGKYLEIQSRLPEGNYSSPSLYFEHVPAIARIALDGSHIYTDTEGKGIGETDWYLVPLPTAWKGKTVTVLFYPHQITGSLRHAIMLGNRSDHIQGMLYEDLPRLIIAVLFFFTSCVVLLIPTRKEWRGVSQSFALLTLSAAFQTVYYSSIKTLLFRDVVLWRYLWIFSSMLMFIGFLQFIARFHEWRDMRRIDMLSALHLVYTICLSITATAARQGWHVPFELARFVFYALELSVSAEILIHSIRSGNREARALAAGLALSIVVTAIGVEVDTQGLPYHKFGSHWGLACLVISFGAVQLVRVRRTHTLEEELREELRQARQRERTLIYADLHDHIGGRLSDLAILVEKERANGTLSNESAEALEFGIRSSMRMLRERLRGFEDEEMLRTDFFLGIQLALARRYTGAGRKVKVSVLDDLNGVFAAGSLSEAAIVFYSILMEIATNDLKRGKGTSEWRISRSEEAQRPFVRVSLRAPCSSGGFDHDGGRGKWTMALRLQRLNGRFVQEPQIDKGGRFSLGFEIPLSVLQAKPETDEAPTFPSVSFSSTIDKVHAGPPGIDMKRKRYQGEAESTA